MIIRKKRERKNMSSNVVLSILLIISINTLWTNNNGFNFAYGQTNQITPSSNEFDIYKIPIQKVKVEDIDIAYKTFGEGNNTILLISGGSNTMNFWDPHLLEELAKNNTVIVFDSRGIGNTTSGTAPFSIKQFANDTVGLLDAIGIVDKVDILGFSLGSLIAQEIAYMHQERIDSLILYGSFCGGNDFIPPSSSALKNFTDTLTNPERSNTSDSKIYSILDNVLFSLEWMQQNPNYLEKIPREGVSIRPSDGVKLLDAFMDWTQIESCNKLNTIKVPTLIIVGTEDSATVPANSINLVKGIPDAWLVQINGGHGVMFQYPEVFTKILQTFLTTLSTL